MDENLNKSVLNTESLDKKLEDKALLELGECVEKREDCIGQMRTWMEMEKRLLTRQDPDFILKFLRCCKFDVEKTKKRIVQYYANRRNYPDWLQNRDPFDKEISKLLNLGLFLPINLDDANRELIVLVHIAKFDLETYNFDAMWKLAFMLLEVCLLKNHVQINGVEVVLDLSNIRPSLIRKFNFGFITRVLTCLLNGMPVRVKGIHLWKAPAIFTAVIAVAQWFLSEKMKKRLHSHGSDMKSLHSLVPSEFLPSEYGGSAGTTKNQIISVQQWFLEHAAYIQDDDQYGYLK